MTNLLSRASKKDSKTYEGGDSDSVFKTMKTGIQNIAGFEDELSQDQKLNNAEEVIKYYDDMKLPKTVRTTEDVKLKVSKDSFGICVIS